MTKIFHNPEPFKSANRPYSMAVKAGKMIFLAGQIGVEFIDGERRVVAPGDAVRQLEVIFANMRAMLEDVEASLADVCWLQFFVTNMDDRTKMDETRRRFFSGDSKPAATLVEVRRLALPGLVVEVNALASLES
ncbi:MAG: RidA family protein [Acetobacteraceae bacterium]